LGLSCGPHKLLAQSAIYPSWWAKYGVQNENSPNDYAAANQGQVKNIAVAAVTDLDTDFAQFGGAGVTLDLLATTLSGTTPQTNDYAAVTLGQLKALAQPFYDQLLAAGYSGPPLTTGTYPWIGLVANDYAMANIGQVKNLFSFDVSYISGISPTLTIVNGSGQEGAPGLFLPTPLVVQVTDASSHQPVANWPVFFDAPAGFVAPDTSGRWPNSSSATVRTGADGSAQVYFQQPMDATSTTSVAAFAGNSEADFTETTLADTNPPAAPGNVSAVLEGDGSVVLCWQDNSDNETGFTIQQSNDGGATWSTVASQWADFTTATLYPTSNLPVINGVTLFQITATGNAGNTSSAGAAGGTATPSPNAAATGGGSGLPPGLTPLPPTNYAVIDLGAMGFDNPLQINDSLQILDDNYRMWSNGNFCSIPQTGIAGQIRTNWEGLSNTGKVYFWIAPTLGGAYLYTWSPTGGLIPIPKISGNGIYVECVSGNGSTYTSGGLVLFQEMTASGDIFGTEQHFNFDSSGINLSQWQFQYKWNTETNIATQVGDTQWGKAKDKNGIAIATACSSGIFLEEYNENSSGVVVGFGEQSGMPPTQNVNGPAIWNKTSTEFLEPPIQDFWQSVAMSINNMKQPIVVGYDNQAGGAVMWFKTNGGWQERNLGPYDSTAQTYAPLSWCANKINDRGEIIGDFGYWVNGDVVDLSTLVSGYYNIWPIDINNSGAMIATAVGDDDGSNHNVLLLPDDIAIKKKGDPNPPPERSGTNGVVVKVGDVLEIALDPTWFDKDSQFQNLITWQFRPLRGDGNWGWGGEGTSSSGDEAGWQSFGDNATGTTFEYTTQFGGIFEVRAIIKSENTTQKILYVRHSKDSTGTHASGLFQGFLYDVGSPNFFGVVSTQKQLDVLLMARSCIGKDNWNMAYSVTIGTGLTLGPGIDLCNVFLYQVFNDYEGVPIPLRSDNSHPPGAHDWWDANYSMAGWPWDIGNDAVEPGMAVARSIPIIPRGHCGILDYDGAWISAPGKAHSTVNRAANIRDGDPDSTILGFSTPRASYYREYQP